MSVDANVGVELLSTSLADKHMANVLPNYVLFMHWQRLEILVTDITEVNPVSHGRLSLLQKAFPQDLQVYDERKCTKLSPIKSFFFQKFYSRVCMMLGLCASLQCYCLTSYWQKKSCSRRFRGRRPVVRGPRGG